MNIRHYLSPPVANLCRDPRWGRVEETYGEDAYMASRLSVACTRAYRELGLVNTAKHMIANYGDGGRDSWPVFFSERDLREYWLRPFEAAVKEGGLMGIMPGYNMLNGKSCSADHWLLTELLRDEWGFAGIVTSDYGQMDAGMKYRHSLSATFEDGAAATINAGLDSCHPNGMQGLPGAVEQGLISEARIDESVRRILRLKMEMGLFDNPYVDPEEATRIVHSDAHQNVALEAARRSIVLLKNEADILPLSKSATVGLAGPAAEEYFSGGYARYVMASDISPSEGIEAMLGAEQVQLHQPGASLETFAKECDAVLYFATIVEGEGRDRSSLDLPVFMDKNPPRAQKDDLTILVEQNERKLRGGDQEQEILDLADTGVPVIVVLVTGSPESVYQRPPWIEPLEDTLRQAVQQQQTPLLAVCLGAQALATAVGGRVVLNPRGWEIGTIQVRSTEAGQADRLLGTGTTEITVQATHQDIIEALPPDAVVLGDPGEQAGKREMQ